MGWDCLRLTLAHPGGAFGARPAGPYRLWRLIHADHVTIAGSQPSLDRQPREQVEEREGGTLLIFALGLSNLDAKLRERALEWFKRIQRTLRLTTIFVTHDQDEALSMSDQVIVMNAGRILQFGPPEEIYRRPTTRFVAEFVGRCNFLPGRVTGRTGSMYEARVDGLDNPLVVCCESRLEPGSEVTLAVRPENVHLSEREPSGGGNTFSASITATSFFGDRYRHELAIGPIRMVCQTPRQPRAGNVTVTVDPDDLIVLSVHGPVWPPNPICRILICNSRWQNSSRGRRRVVAMAAS